MSNPFTFVIPALLAIAFALLFGMLFRGGAEKPKEEPDASETETAALRRENSELKRRLKSYRL